jgi:hypothetical protein
MSAEKAGVSGDIEHEFPDRICWSCRNMLPWSEFARDRSKPSGHKSICKRCDSARAIRRYHARRALENPLTSCGECGEPLPAGRRVVCSSRCRDRRYARLHPEAYEAREARKVERRRERRCNAREAS